MTNSEKRQPKRVDIYEEFIQWSALPPTERMKQGIETQEQFVEFYKIGINTPTAWKRRKDFEVRVTIMRREWAFGKTSAIIEGMYRSAMKGNPFSQKLWLQYFHGFNEKQEVPVVDQRVTGVNDVLALIAILPEEQKEKHYEWIKQFLLDASLAHQKAQQDGDDSAWHEPLPADWKPRYTLHDSYEDQEEEKETDEERTDRIINELESWVPKKQLASPVTPPLPVTSVTDCCDPSIPSYTCAQVFNKASLSTTFTSKGVAGAVY